MKKSFACEGLFLIYKPKCRVYRLEARGERQKALRTDTLVVTEWREKVIELPPERYVPKFYKWCTGLLWAILVLAIGRLALKRWL